MKKLIRDAKQVYRGTSIRLSTVHSLFLAHCPMSAVRCRHFCHLDKHQCSCPAWLLFPQLNSAQSSPLKTRLQLAPSCLVSFLWLHFCVFSSSSSRSSRSDPPSSVLGVWGLLCWHISLKARGSRGTAPGRTANRSSFLAFC